MQPVRSLRALLVLAALVAAAVLTPSSPTAAQEAPPIVWAVNGFGTNAAETAATTTTFEVLIDGASAAEAITVAPGERVEIPGLVAGSSFEISFRNTSSGDTTAATPISPTIDDTVDVVVHPDASGDTAVTAFVNAAKQPSDGSALTIRHVAATDATEFRLYTGGGESGGALEPTGDPVTVSNGGQVRSGETLATGVAYTLEAQLPSGATSRISFTGGGGEVMGNQVVYLSGLNDTSGALAAGESGPFITPVLATSGGGEGGSAGLAVINGFSEGPTESTNSYTVLLNGIAVGSEGGLTVGPGERIAIPQAARGETFTVGFRNGTTTVDVTDVVVPESGSVDVAVYSDGGTPTATVFDNNAVSAPPSGATVVMRNLSDGAVGMEIVEGGSESGGGSTVGAPVSPATGTEVEYGTTLSAGAILYAPVVEIGATRYRGDAFIVGGETTNSEVRAVYAVGSETPAGEASPVRSFVVVTGDSTQPLAIVNGFGPGATESANTYGVIVNGLRLAEATVGPRSRVMIPLQLERGATATVGLTDAASGAVQFETNVDIPLTGTVDLAISPDDDGRPTTTAYTNRNAPMSGTTLLARHAAGVGTVDVSLYEGGGESGGALTRVAGPTPLAPDTGVELATGLSSALTYQLETTFTNGTILTTSFQPGAESGGALQAAYLVGLGSGGTQTNASLLPFVVSAGSGSEPVVSIRPVRLVETREGLTTVDNQAEGGGPIEGGTQRTFQIAGRGEIPADATGIVANVTTVDGVAPGFLTPFPCGDRPNASLLNWTSAAANANATLLPLSGGGEICVFAQSTVDVVIDVQGYLTADSPIEALTPTRLVETRTGVGLSTADGLEQGGGKIAADSQRTFQIAGREGVPLTAKAVVANFTVVDGEGAGFLTPFPCGERPTSSLLNWDSPAADANATIIPLSETGELCVYAQNAVDVVIDVQGYLQSTSAITTFSPVRLVETREGLPTVDGLEQGTGAIGATSQRVFDVVGREDIPAGATAVIANFTVVNGAIPGFITPYPCGTRPNSSLVNWDSPAPDANATVMPLSATGQLCVYAHESVDVVVDVSGYVGAGGGG